MLGSVRGARGNPRSYREGAGHRRPPFPDIAASGRASARSTRAEGRGLGRDHGAVGGDVAKEPDVATMVPAAIERFGRIDILVNNAGVPESSVPRVDGPLSHCQRLIDIHLT
jgi:NAD(P)-dependent dehydrogenase (short-subunit alcohol dehydrogenase family)